MSGPYPLPPRASPPAGVSGFCSFAECGRPRCCSTNWSSAGLPSASSALSVRRRSPYGGGHAQPFHSPLWSMAGRSVLGSCVPMRANSALREGIGLFHSTRSGNVMGVHFTIDADARLVSYVVEGLTTQDHARAFFAAVLIHPDYEPGFNF